jgi:hypothetical protein
VTFGGNIQGDLNDTSTSQPIFVIDEPPIPIEPPLILPVPPTPVVFGSNVGSGKTFSVTVHVTDPDAADILSLALGTLPAGVTNTLVSGGGVSPQGFTITGTVSYSLNKTTVTIPFNVTDGVGGHTVPGSFDLVVTPEPASLTALGGTALTGLVRRRK